MLLLEDDIMLTSIVRNIAQNFRKELIATDSVQKAVLIQIKTKPELIITDFHLGDGITSISLLELLKRQGTEANVTIYTSDQNALRGLKQSYSNLGWNFIDKNEPGWPNKLKNWLNEVCV